MISLDSLKNSYSLKGLDSDFSIGRRSEYRFATPTQYLHLNKLNLNGPDPVDYINFAKSDLNSLDKKGAINAITNTNRAIHLLVKNFFMIFSLWKTYSKTNFPTKLELISELELFPTEIIGLLNKKRNIVEHDYQNLQISEARNFIEIGEFLLLISYPFLRNAVVGGMVGIVKDNVCYEYRIDIENTNIQIFILEHNKYLETDIGRIYYNFNQDLPKILLKDIPIKKTNKEEWISIINLFIYLTKREVFGLYNNNDSAQFTRSEVTCNYLE